MTDEVELSGVAEPYERVSFMLLNSDNMGFENAEDTVKKYYENIDAGVKMSGTEIFHFENVKANSNGEWSYTIPMAGFVAQDGREAVDLTLVISTGEQEFIRYQKMNREIV